MEPRTGTGTDPRSDADLIAAARSGDAGGFGVLYQRHAGAALVVARQYTSGTAQAEDVVADAFAAVWSALRSGSGPTDAFRAYLFTVVRRTAAVQRDRGRRAEPTDDVAVLEAGSMAEPAAEEPALADFERSIVARAFSSLPERWQAVLWHSEIEGKTPAEIAPLLGLTANSTAALAYRAREGLRQAYLQQHLSDALPDACRAVAGKLGGYVRGGLGARDTTQVEAHLETCGDCRALVLELRDVNHGLRAVVAPLVLGVVGLAALKIGLPTSGGLAAGTTALASGGTAAGATAGAGAAGASAAATGAGAAGVAGAGAAAGAAGATSASAGGLLAVVGGFFAAVPTALVAGVAGAVVIAGVTMGAVALNGAHDGPGAAAPGSSTAPSTPGPAATSSAPGGTEASAATDGTMADTGSPSDPDAEGDAAVVSDGPAGDTSEAATSETPGGDTSGPGSSGSDSTPTAPPLQPVLAGTPQFEVQDGDLTLSPGEPGQTLAVDVHNTGNGPATHVVAQVALPTGVAGAQQLSGPYAVRIAVAGWDCTPTSTGALCSTQRLDPGDTTHLTVRVDVAPDFSGGDVTWQISADGLPATVSHPSTLRVNHPTPTQTPTPDPTPTPTQTSTPDPTPTPTQSASPDPTPTETQSPDPTPTPSQSTTPDPTPSPTPSSDPTPPGGGSTPPTCTNGSAPRWWGWGWPWPCWPWW